MTILISEVRAQEAIEGGAPQEGFSLTSFVPLLLIFAVFYFLIIRPQSKKMKEHQEMVKALKKGDKVVTSGGIIGVVTGIDEAEDLAEVSINSDTVIKIVRGHVTQIVEKKEVKLKKDKK